MNPSLPPAVHCINPACPSPYPQPWGSNFCQSCGAPLRLYQRYIPLQLLGSGGFAAIYTVYDLQNNLERVLKVLIETAPKALELFEQEANVLAHLHHPGVPKVESDGYFQVMIDRNTQQVLPCLVMEKINGQTLQDILERHPQGCPEAWVLDWLNQAVDILQELHSRQIIHRDLKPTNFMLRQETQRLVVIDFGGAKQIGQSQAAHPSSTRLVSPGYSPPEQISGGVIGPPADFYALGRTCIHLLTGKYPADLEHPLTGELQWRHLIPITPALADLLDEMVKPDPRQRPVSAIALRNRLATISLNQTAILRRRRSLSTLLGQGIQTGVDGVLETLTLVGKGAGDLALALYRGISWTVRAGLDTTWEATLGSISGGLGTVIGFLLAYWTPIGPQIARILTQSLSLLVPDLALHLGAEVVLFGFAGWATAWGLTEAGGFGQRKRAIVAGLMGIVGYELGWLVWQALVDQSISAGVFGFSAIAAIHLVLGLGLPSHHLVHTFVVAIGTASLLAGLATLNLFPPGGVLQILMLAATHATRPDWGACLGAIAFFSILGMTQALWLGISYYVVVPILRFLGWR